MFDLAGAARRFVCVAFFPLWQLSFAQVPVEELAKPPADALQFTVLSTSGVHGRSAIWTASDGSIVSRDSISLRGRVSEVEQTARLGKDGVPVSIVVRGFTPDGDAAETFAIRDGKATWKSPVDQGHADYVARTFYVPQGGTFGSSQLFLEALLASPDRSLDLLPGGRAHGDRLTEAVVGEGSLRRTVIAWTITGVYSSPFTVWSTGEGKFFGFVGGLAVLPVGYEDALRTMQKIQSDAIAAKSPALVESLLHEPSGPVAFTHVRAFVNGDHFESDWTVVVDKGVIVALGPSDLATVPSSAQVIDGTGKSLVPGLWDSHQHVGSDYKGPFLLALGITSVRDPGSNNQLTIDRAARRAAGRLLFPHVYPSVLIDRKGPYAAQLGIAVTTLDEGLAAIRDAKANGFSAVKIYGSYDPAWVKPSAAEAHRLGLHVHGHVPAGMRPSEAIAAGYDEISHIYFAMMEAMPEEILATSNGANRFAGTGRYAKDVDLDGKALTSLLELMVDKHTVMDPTLVLTEGLYMPEAGDLSPAYAPYAGTMPPASERYFREGGYAVPNDLTRADFRKSQTKLIALVTAMHKAGIPIVAGTDGSGMELVRELEIYVEAGFTTSEALASATIVAARNVQADKRTGSVELGKIADLVLVDGDPSTHIGDLRNTRLVMMDGKMMDADALRAAAGFSGRPKNP
jgi:imidazolonepropionase-like amidohydrolase